MCVCVWGGSPGVPVLVQVRASPVPSVMRKVDPKFFFSQNSFSLPFLAKKLPPLLPVRRRDALAVSLTFMVLIQHRAVTYRKRRYYA